MPAVVTAVVIAIAWLVLKPRAISGPAGEQSVSAHQAVTKELPADGEEHRAVGDPRDEGGEQGDDRDSRGRPPA
jgi:hypothetical protein